MLKNYFTIALRNFRKDKWYSILNILGLTIGITFSLFLFFYIKDELNFDHFNVKAERIYRVNSFIKEPEKDTMKLAITPFPLGPAFKKDYPEVEEAVRFVGNDKMLFKAGDVNLYEEKVFYCDSNVFNVFTYQFLQGSPGKALTEPNSIVLTESMAKKYFPSGISDIVGKALQDDEGHVFKVTALIADVPKNSHLIFNGLISENTLPPDFANNWGGFNFYTYLLMKPNTNVAAFEKKLAPVYEKYLAPIFAQFNIKIHFELMPITSIHLHSTLVGEPEAVGDMSYIYIFSAVILFMLLIASINYMNLTTARSSKRAKEIGIRKVAGSHKNQLIAQFLVESILTAFAALLLSIVFVYLLLPVFNTLSGKHISFSEILDIKTLFILIAIVLFVGFAGGSYPAFYLSKFNPIDVLKGKLSKSSGNAILRKSLVVVQFSISMIMIICTWIVYSQLKYVQNKDLGFNKNQVISLAVNSNKEMRGEINTFTNEIQRDPNIRSVSTAQTVPGGTPNFNLFSIETKSGYKDQGVDCYGIDENYFKTLGIQLVNGRNFSSPSDTLNNIIVNENMVKYFGWNDPIGKMVKRPGDTTGFAFHVIGVVKDFNQKSLYNPIAPLLFFYRPASHTILVKLQSQNIPTTIASIEKTWKAQMGGIPFAYTFLDQDFNKQYTADQDRGKIFTAFSILTILITCLGLLGLIAFTTQQRQKEISIRKVLGAGFQQVIPLLMGNFILLVGISCLIAFPVAYLFMDKWLKIFPYNTGITALPFILSAVCVLVITIITVLFHTIKASIANPVNSLRSE
ncbi:MAG: ABC transporter permease [Bacteroidota bacterium]